jgi:putative RecB family exonuclease
MSFNPADHPLPRALSPSRLNDFQACPRKYEYSAVRKIKQPASYASVKGRFVHAILEYLFGLPADERTIDRATSPEALARAQAVVITDDVRLDLTYDSALEAKLLAETSTIIATYFAMEDPTQVVLATVDDQPGIEIGIREEIQGAPLYGILDRLDRDSDGGLVIVDYKTGSVPRNENYLSSAFANAALYVELCKAKLSETPVKIRLLYVGAGRAVERTSAEIFPEARAHAASRAWSRIGAAYEAGDFPATPSASACRFCPEDYKALCRADGVKVVENVTR